MGLRVRLDITPKVAYFILFLALMILMASLDTCDERWSVVFVDSVTEDFVGESAAEDVKVHVGREEANRLLGKDGKGPLPVFLEQAMKAQRRGRKVAVINVRDLHDPLDVSQLPELGRHGDHNLIGTAGAEVVAPIQVIYDQGRVDNVDVTALSIPFPVIRDSIYRVTGIDMMKVDQAVLDLLDVILVGSHTNNRIIGSARTLRHGFRVPNVMVCPHLVASNNRQAHLDALRLWMPDILVDVVQSVGEACDRLRIPRPDPDQITWQESCELNPASLVETLNVDQRSIIQNMFMGRREVKLQELSGGWSGSLLFLATPIRDDGAAEKTVVVKIDRHAQVRKEVEGYGKVKDLVIGQNIPAFEAPVFSGEYSGFKMDLAALDGEPHTFQSKFETAQSQDEIAAIEGDWTRLLNKLVDGLYANTRGGKTFSPVKQFRLDEARKATWLKEKTEWIVPETHDQAVLQLTDDIQISNPLDGFLKIAQSELRMEGVVCLEHGDLNLKNVIFDALGNFGLIDWTHCREDAMECDFGEMENEVKFVMSKDFEEADFPQLVLFEQFLLDNLELPEMAQLPVELEFVKTDYRFNKIYRLLSVLRSAYVRARGNTDNAEVIYNASLLRYSAYTIGFDARRESGECPLPSLKYALLSTSMLVEKLTPLLNAA